MSGCYLETAAKSDCSGCGACQAVCPVGAISMRQDEEGFFYPHTDKEVCIHCGKCFRTCPLPIADQLKHKESQEVYGGWHLDDEVLAESTSGGIFSALCRAFGGQGRVYGACTKGKGRACHSFVEGQMPHGKEFRASKYTQSMAGNTFQEIHQQLKEGKKVLFSGTPCQIAGLRSYLGGAAEGLTTVEVICEGVPSPLFMDKQIAYMEKKYGKSVKDVNYRFKAVNRWDYEVMRFTFEDGSARDIDRWFNPFWSIWLQHLMSRPGCYDCRFCTRHRVADITLGDLWGVHIYCPDLYNDNRGASVVFVNTEKGRKLLENASQWLHIRSLDPEQAIRYQGPLRQHIASNSKREEFMQELRGKSSYEELCHRWAVRPSLKLLIRKYVWGMNRQKVWWWRVRQRIRKLLG